MSGKQFFFYSRRDHAGPDYFEHYRCYDVQQQVVFEARAPRLGKPILIFNASAGEAAVAEIRNRAGYLVNGKTDFLKGPQEDLLGSYTRSSHVLGPDGQKLGRWRDARCWREEFKENLVDAVANALLGSGDAPGGSNAGDTHLFSSGKEISARLQRERLAFFPDPPKSQEPSKLARFASKVIPGELGKSLAEVRPPMGWSLTVAEAAEIERSVMLYAALYRIEYLRFARSG